MKNRVKEIRLEMNMTQTELSEKSNVSRTTISMIENHQLDNIESNTMFKIAVALGKDVSDIFFTESVVLTQQEGE